MQAIQTKYIGPTDTRAARMKAQSQGGERLSIPYDYELSDGRNHAAAARALLARLKWPGNWTAGTFGDAVYWTSDAGGDRIDAE